VQKARLHLCRHGEVDVQWRTRIYGGHDVALAPAGRERFDRLAASLAELEISAVYCSSLERARDGARRLAEPHGLEVIVDPRLVEIDRGAWVGLTLEEIEARWPGGVQAYLDDPNGYAEHGGETHAVLAERIFPALEDIAARHLDQSVLVVCHGQVMRAAVARILEIPGARSLDLMTTYGGLTTLDRYLDGSWVVQAVNAPTLRSEPWGGRTFKP